MKTNYYTFKQIENICKIFGEENLLNINLNLPNLSLEDQIKIVGKENIKKVEQEKSIIKLIYKDINPIYTKEYILNDKYSEWYELLDVNITNNKEFTTYEIIFL